MIPRPCPRRLRRRVTVALTGAATGLTLSVVLAAPALAHAQIIGSVPATQTELSQAPDSVTVNFDDTIGITPNSVVVTDAAGHRVDRADAHHGLTGGDVVVDLAPRLPAGQYRAAYRVQSDDGHPVTGTISFSVRVPPAPATAPVAGSVGSDVAAAAGRTLSVTGLLVALGGLLLWSLAWPAALRRARAWRVVVAGAVAGTAGSALALAAQGPYAAGRPLTAVTDPALWRLTFSGPTGALLAVRVGLLAAVTASLLVLRRRALAGLPRPVAGQATPLHPGRAVAARLAVPLGLLAAALPTWAFAGHARRGPGGSWTVVSDVVHLVALSVWIGGLVSVAAALLPARRGQAAARLDATDSAGLRRFSRLAGYAVGVVVVTGVVQSVHTIGSFGALTTTTYGQVYLAKMAGFTGLVGLGALARRLLATRPPRRTAVFAAGPGLTVNGAPAPAPATDRRGAGAPGTPDAAELGPVAVRRLRRSTAVETALALATLVLAGALVNAAPARGGSGTGWQVRLPAGRLAGVVSLTRTAPGNEALHVTLRDRVTGAPADAVAVDAAIAAGYGAFVNARLAVAPQIRLLRTGVGRYVGVLPFGSVGQWTVQVRVTHDGLITTGTAPVGIRPQ